METNTIASATQQISQIKEKGIDFLYQRGPNLLGAIIILVAGYMVARFLCRLLGKWLEKRHLEPPVRMLLTRLVWLVIMALFVMVALGTLGIAVGPLIALMSVAGVGVGLAMQGVLSNLVAGLLIIFTKPFRVGEYIEIIGCAGQVNTIDMFTTVLVHPDRSRVVIPNRKIVGEVLHNYGNIRQQNISIGVAYSTNLPAAIAVINQVLIANPRVLKDVPPVVVVGAFADSSIEILVKPWTSVNDFGLAAAEIKLAILESFRSSKIEIPFPQREIRVLNAGSSKL
ncbi:MAG: mechanosensitive ion channel [Verrucomicrobia bacterium]|nr:mechanosensitive ion channel [Verrucomicrobiota bacterium]